MSDQQMARVNVDLETWQSFRIEAIRRGRSIADWLGDLVVREVARIERAASPPESPRDEPDRPREDDAGEQPTQRGRPRTSPKVVNGQTLLTELPHAGSKPPPWEP